MKQQQKQQREQQSQADLKEEEIANMVGERAEEESQDMSAIQDNSVATLEFGQNNSGVPDRLEQVVQELNIT